jgi:hypothetical protein
VSEEPKFEFDFGDGEEVTPEGGDADAGVDKSVEVDTSKKFDPALEELLKGDPAQLKAAKKLWYENKRFRDAGFKSPDEAIAQQARVAKIATDLGRTDGKVGLDAFEAEAGEWAATWAGFQAGDPKVVDTWFESLKDNPASLNKILTQSDRKFQELNPAGWAHTHAKVFMDTLKASGKDGQSVLGVLNQMWDAVGDNKAAQKLLSRIAEGINAIDGISTKAPEEGGIKPDADAARNKDLDLKDWKIYTKSVDISASPLIKSAATQAAKAILGARTVSAETRAAFEKDIEAEFFALTKANPTFQQNMNDLLKERQTDRFQKMLKSELRRTMPNAARRVNKKYTGLSSSAADKKIEAGSRTESAAGGAVNKGAAAMNWGRAPQPGEVDWRAMDVKTGSRRKSEDMFSERTFYAKGKPGVLYYF